MKYKFYLVITACTSPLICSYSPGWARISFGKHWSTIYYTLCADFFIILHSLPKECSTRASEINEKTFNDTSRRNVISRRRTVRFLTLDNFERFDSRELWQIRYSGGVVLRLHCRRFLQFVI